MKNRYGQDPSTVVRSKDPTFFRPFKKGKNWWPSGDMIFVCSWSDFFHPAADNWRPQAWRVIRERPDLVFQILTKRIHLVEKRLPSTWGDGWPNVWLGATVENQPRANERIPILLQIPAAVRFVSIEPMLGSVDLEHVEWFPGKSHTVDVLRGGTWDLGGGFTNHGDMPSVLGWVIAGAETGPGARPMHPGWARDVRDQCQSAGVPFFLKQLTGQKSIPQDLRIREYPNAQR